MDQGLLETRAYVRVTDVKEYTFCPRVYYYETCLPGLHHHTVKTQAGVHAHQRERALARRRSLAAYGLVQGKRTFDVLVISQRFGMIGEIDEVVTCPDEAIPVDYKNTTRIGHHFKLQLAAYGLMLAESTGQVVCRGFFYLIPARRAEEVAFTSNLGRAAEKALIEMRLIAEAETVPLPTRFRDRCVACKYRRFCNDV